MLRSNYFAKKRLNSLTFALVLLAVTVIAIIMTEYDVAKGLTSIPQAFIWGASNFYPTAESFEKLPDIWVKLQETLLVSVAATTTGAVFALFFAIFGASTTRVNTVLGTIARGIATVFRNIDIAAWSMILLFAFSQNVMTGYLALFFGSFGFLTRAFMETIDEASAGPVEALRATGASYFPIVFQSVLPASLPQMLSWVLFMVETNIRQATLVGILTGTGVGFIFTIYYKSMNYHTASLVVLMILAAIMVIEFVSNYVRRTVL